VVHPDRVLVRHGANLPRGVADDQWWRYLTATLLHVGLWHIGFNLLGLAVVGPHVERNYGRLGLPLLFVLTGALASIGSQLTGMWGAGASGALMGLCGAIAGAGHRSGTTIGTQERNQMLRWAAYTVIFGFGIGADNHAHVAGFVAGALFGLLVPTEARTPRWAARTIRLIGALSLVAILGAAALVMAPPRGPAPFGAEPARSPEEQVAVDMLQCKLAQQVAREENRDDEPDDASCVRIEALRRYCHATRPAFLSAAERAECTELEANDQEMLQTRPDD
jgi:rhomboid protease GluP